MGHHEGVAVPGEPKPNKGRKTARGTASSRAPRPEPAQRPVSESSEHESDDEFRESSVMDSSLSESDLEQASGSSGASSEYSDWGDNNLTPPQRTAKQRAAESRPASASEDEEQKPGPSKYFKRKKYPFSTTNIEDIPEEYHPSKWLALDKPQKSPYFPQMGDEVMYYRQGHLAYINLVQTRKAYKINSKEQAWLKRDDLRAVELVKVVGIKYDIRPPRLCCLKLALLDPEGGDVSGQAFSIKYHDMDDVVDFLVLRHNHESAMSVTWSAGDSYRCQIESQWWHGKVLQVSPLDPALPDSPFLSIKCLWDSGEEERLSPWDLEQIPADLEEEEVNVTREDIEKHLYRSTREEWRGLDHKSECERISRSLAEVMELAAAESFQYPVDLSVFPDYMLEIQYPMDFNLIKQRLDNLFYRRSTAVQFDVRYIATNTECYNVPKSDIVKYARIVTDLVLKVIQDPNMSDVIGEYHRLLDNFKWEDTQEASKARVRKGRRSQDSAKDTPNPKQWKHDCNELLNTMFADKDSEPFRVPVDEEEYPDYHRAIATAMDLTQVRESLRVGEYDTPFELQKDVLLIFSNSFAFNVDKKSSVVGMTKRLKEKFLDYFNTVVTNWRKVNRRINFLKNNPGRSPVKTPSKKTPTKRAKPKTSNFKKMEESDEEDDNTPPVKKSALNRRKSLVLSSDFDSDDNERPRPKNKGKGKGKGKSSKPLPKPVALLPPPEEESEDDIPISRRTPQKKTINKSSVKGFRKHIPRYKEDSEEEEEEDADEEEEEVQDEEDNEETPDSEEGGDDETPKKKKLRKKETPKKKIRESWECEKPSPKRSARAKVVSHDDTDSEDEEKQVSRKRRVSSRPSATLDPGEGTSRTLSPRKSFNAARPRRQATAKALDKFQKKSSSEEDTEEEEEVAPRRRPPLVSPAQAPAGGALRPRRQVRPLQVSDESEEEVVPAPHRRRAAPLSRSETVSEESNLEAAGRSRRGEGRMAGVIISAADSSTDPRRARGLAGAEEVRGVERRSTRPVVRPARLQDYSEEEERSSRRGRKRKSRSYREEGEEEEEEEEPRARRREGIMSPKAKRSKDTEVNYRDQSEDEEEDESLSLRREMKRRKRKEEQASTAKRKSPNKSTQSNRGKRSRETVTYEEDHSDEEELNNEEDGSESEEGVDGAEGGDDSDVNFGRRRGMRARKVPVTATNPRPQRRAGGQGATGAAGARPTYREPSTDDDLPPRRRHR